MTRHIAHAFASLVLASTLLAAGCPTEDELPTNSAPWADAGDSVSTSVGIETTLDGTGSYDPDEDSELTFHWAVEAVPEGSELVADDIAPNGSADAFAPVFVPDRQGLYVIRLRVSDGELDSQSDFVHVMADVEGSLPVADAGADQQATEGDTVDLDGSGSHDPLGGTLTYSWYMVATPVQSSLTTADIASADQAGASFEPDAPGVFLIGLQVNNGTTDSVPDFASVEVSSTNACPTASGEASGGLYSCTDIDLDASASTDPDGDALMYSWRHLLPPFGSSITESDFADPTAETTTFFADSPGTYTVQVTVNDGECESVPDQFDIVITIRPQNEAPVADASGQSWYADNAECTNNGGNWWCQQCEELEIQIDGSGSTDADGDPLSFHWENLYDPANPLWANYKPAQIDDPSAEIVTAKLQDAHAVYGTQTSHQYVFQLTVTDCMGDTDMLNTNFSLVYGCTGVAAP